jgi:hypothetical protein
MANKAAFQARFREAMREAVRKCDVGEISVSAERVRRITERIGTERVAERDAQVAAYEALPIPARREGPANQPKPSVVCVQMDGGRLQIFDRELPERNENNTLWREMKVGCLWTMTSEVSADDPCPQLPRRVPRWRARAKNGAGNQGVFRQRGRRGRVGR